MSLTKRYIEELQEKAAAGDRVVREQLAKVGLWNSPEEFQEEAENEEENFEPLGLDRFWVLNSADENGDGEDCRYSWCGSFDELTDADDELF